VRTAGAFPMKPTRTAARS